MFIIKYKNWFFALTGAIVVASLISIGIFGLKLGLDFTGGSLVQVSYSHGRPSSALLETALKDNNIQGYSVRDAGTSDYIIRAQTLTNVQRANLASMLTFSTSSPAVIAQLTEIGPTIGAELRAKSLVAISLVLVCILMFIAFAFRKVSEPVSSWVYGLIALVTLLHDILVPVGFYAYLGHMNGAQIDTLFVTAVLTVLGFSIHDTIVVFDRVRENLARNKAHNVKESFAHTAGKSLQQTFVRSINTSLTVLFTLLVLFFVGPASTRDFSLTLLVGIIAGTYSSVFLATPLLVWVAGRKSK